MNLVGCINDQVPGAYEFIDYMQLNRKQFITTFGIDAVAEAAKERFHVDDSLIIL